MYAYIYSTVTQTMSDVPGTATVIRRLNRPAFFKKIFIEEREKYLDVLYTQEEIATAFGHESVQAHKKELAQLCRVIAIIYFDHIKADNPKGRAAAFTDAYNANN